jgi:hypothetical protein
MHDAGRRARRPVEAGRGLMRPRLGPPAWTPFTGPVLAGVTAGLAAPHVTNVWLLILLATTVGLLPVVGYQVWKRLHHKG